MLPCSQFIVLASAAFSITAALPQRTAITQAPKPANCTDISSPANYNSSCWDQLNVPSYLTEWQATIPTCNASSANNNACCNKTEYWANCFLRLATGVKGGDCSAVGGPSCNYSAQISPSLLSSPTAPQINYVLRGIVAINEFFDAYYGARTEGALQTAALAAITTIGEIGDSFDYSGSTLLNYGNAQSALFLGLPFFGTPSLQDESFSNASPLLEFGRKFLESLERTPNMSSSIWLNTTSAYAYPLRFTASQLPGSRSLLRTYASFNAALVQAMSSVPTFLDFSANGTWISPVVTPTYLSKTTPGVDFAVLTYATSSTLAQQNFSITLPAATGLNDAVRLTDFQRSAHYNGTNILQTPAGTTIYWSPNTQRQYQFNHSGTGGPKNGTVVDPYSVLKLIEENQWADLPTMFDGAYNCTRQGFVKPLTSVVHILPNGTVDMSCLSALPVYLTEGTSCPAGAARVNGTCPFPFHE